MYLSVRGGHKAQELVHMAYREPIRVELHGRLHLLGLQEVPDNLGHSPPAGPGPGGRKQGHFMPTVCWLPEDTFELPNPVQASRDPSERVSCCPHFLHQLPGAPRNSLSILTIIPETPPPPHSWEGPAFSSPLKRVKQRSSTCQRDLKTLILHPGTQRG